MQELEQQLKAPFDEVDIEWRVQQSGFTKAGKPYAQVLAYVDNRAIMDRLDAVFTIAGWMNEYKEAPDGGILCGISAEIEGNWITKWDGADKTNIEATKGGLSNSMKRAAVQWGIGRYLYSLPTKFVDVTEQKGDNYIKIEDKKSGQVFYGYWNTPKLPEWARPTHKEA